MKILIPLTICLLLCAQAFAAAPAKPNIPDTHLDPLDKAWRAIETPSRELDTRAIMTFILEAAGSPDYQRRSPQIETALKCLERMQDRDPASKTYGNFCAYWYQSAPADNNVVEFVVQKAAVLRLKFYGHLSSPACESLDQILELSIEGILRHRVNVGYTNIFLMKIWNLLALGESLKRPDLVKEGESMLDEWIEFTSKNGIREFLSTTYYGIDLDSLGLMAGALSNPTVRNKAESALRLFWTNIAANWFDPAGRLGGAHGRDYDYLTGHGYLDHHLLAAGWIKSGQAHPFPPVFAEAVRWAPPKELHRQALSAIPRFVFQKWDASDTAWASQYVGHHFSLGVIGSAQGPDDKPFALNLAGPAGSKTVMVNFFMDGRNDPYGTLKKPTGRAGRLKAPHLVPLFRAVQSGAEALFLASYPFDGPDARKPESDLVCLQSHMDLPIEAEVWTSEHALACDRDSEELPGNICFLRRGDVAVGIRFLLALDTAGKPVPVRVFNDGTALAARRLTVTHDASHPGKGRGTVAVWVRAEEGLDDAGFAAFRRNFIQSESMATTEGTLVRSKAGEPKTPMVLEVDLADGKILRSEGGNPAMQVAPFSVNGSEYGNGILNNGAPAGFQFTSFP